MLERVLVCLLAQGHLLIEGVPGLATRAQPPGSGSSHCAPRAVRRRRLTAAVRKLVDSLGVNLIVTTKQSYLSDRRSIDRIKRETLG